MEVAHKRRVQDAITLNVGYLYSLGSKITARFSPNVAKLLADSQVKVRDRKGFPLPLGALENQTLSNLQLRGSCYGDAKLSKSEDETLSAVIATRSVAKGETLQAVPAHLFRSAKSSFSRCISSRARHVCLLTDAAMIPVGVPGEANVALQWRDDKPLKDFLRDGGIEAPAASASLDLVAQKNIEIGHKVSTRFDAYNLLPRCLPFVSRALVCPYDSSFSRNPQFLTIGKNHKQPSFPRQIPLPRNSSWHICLALVPVGRQLLER